MVAITTQVTCTSPCSCTGMIKGGEHNCTLCLGHSWVNPSAVGLTAWQGLGQHMLLTVVYKREGEGKGEGEKEGGKVILALLKDYNK